MNNTLLNRVFGSECDRLSHEMANMPEELKVKQHSNRYFFEYRFIPDLVSEVMKEKLPVDVLVSVDGWKPFLAENVEGFSFDWDQFKFDYCKINENDLLIVYQFPMPMQVPEALWGAVLVKMDTKETWYFTLEYSFDNEWVLGRMTDERHANYGRLEDPSLERFVRWVVRNVCDENCEIKLSALSLDM